MSNFPNLVGPSATGSSLIADSERTINLYPERIEALGAKPSFPWCLLPTPGYALFATLPTVPCRGLYAFNDHVYAVGGNQLYEVFADGSVTAYGATVTLGTDPVTWACNGALGNQLLFTSGRDAYVLNLTTLAVSKVLTATADQVVFLDDRFVALNRQANQIQVSALLDGTSWPGLGVASRSIAADPWQAMAVSHRQLWLIGQTSGESWYDPGTDPDQPFAVDPSSMFQYGIAAPASLVEHDNAPTWIGQTRDGKAVILRAEGYAPRRISTHAVEYQLQHYPTIADAIAYTEQYEGHAFYTVIFPTAQAGWSYDAASGLWHERLDWKPLLNAYIASRVMAHVFAMGSHLVADRLSGGIYQASTSLATDMDGQGVRRLRRTPHLSNEQMRVFVNQLQLDLDVGGGLVAGQGSDPMLMLRYSKDGGHTWSNERWVTAGQLGQYGARAMWNVLGMGRDWVFEITLSDPVISAAKWVQAFIDAETGLN